MNIDPKTGNQIDMRVNTYKLRNEDKINTNLRPFPAQETRQFNITHTES